MLIHQTLQIPGQHLPLLLQEQSGTYFMFISCFSPQFKAAYHIILPCYPHNNSEMCDRCKVILWVSVAELEFEHNSPRP